MATIQILVGWSWGVQKTQGQNSQTGVMQEGKMLFFVDPVTQTQIQVPLDISVAEDMGGQLLGEAPKKHVEVADPQVAQRILQAMRDNGGQM
jgi:hypothetical protein